MAIKMEEVEVMAIERMVHGSEIHKVRNIEKKMFTALNYKLLPDTLDFWLESFIKFWDHFASSKTPSPLPLFFKSSIL